MKLIRISYSAATKRRRRIAELSSNKRSCDASANPWKRFKWELLNGSFLSMPFFFLIYSWKCNVHFAGHSTAIFVCYLFFLFISFLQTFDHVVFPYIWLLQCECERILSHVTKSILEKCSLCTKHVFVLYTNIFKYNFLLLYINKDNSLTSY